MPVRAELVAMLCTLVLFGLFGLFLFVDHQRAGGRLDIGRITPAEPVPSELPAAKPATVARPAAKPEPAAVRAPDSAVVAVAEKRVEKPAGEKPAAPTPAPARAEPPAITAGQRAALNEVLKAAAQGAWLKVDELLLSSVSASAGSSRGPEMRTLIERAVKTVEAGDYPAAIEASNAVLAAHPAHAEARAWLALALLRQGNIDEAHAHVTRSLAIEPVRGATWLTASEILAERGNAAAAKASLRVAIHLSANRDRTLRFLKEADRNVPSASFRAVVAEVLPEVPKIPTVRSNPS